MDTAGKVTAILSELSGAGDIRPDARLQTDLGLDSLQMVTLLILLEDSFGITLDEADMNPFDLTTAEQVTALVRKYTGDSDETGN